MIPPPSDRRIDSADSEIQLNTLIELTHIFNSSLDLMVVLDRVMECAKSVMEAEASSLLLRDKETNDLLWKSATGKVGKQVMSTVRHPSGSGIAGWVVEHREPTLIEDAYQDPRFNPAMDRKTGFRTRSMLCAPLIVRGEVIGVAQVINRKPQSGRETFSEEDLEFFCRICDSAAIAIQNALLHEEIIREERQRRDLELAKTIQQSFLPSPTGELKGYKVSVLNRPALMVGGDFYEFFRIGDDVYFFCIGDVSGKGVSAALYMARIISDLRYMAPDLKEPSLIFERLNQALFERAFSHMFVTLLGGVLEPGNHTLHMSCAGHPHPIRMNPANLPEVLEVPTQPPLGLVEDQSFEQVPVFLEPGESLLLYTDGLPESRNADHEMLGVDGLTDWLTGQEKRGEALLEALFDRVLFHSGGESIQDDLTAVLIDRPLHRNPE